MPLEHACPLPVIPPTHTCKASEPGLALLHAINRSAHGWASIAELSASTGLHRTTVRRLLETLQSEGVRRSASDDSYRLNLKVRQLSDGFTDDEWISEVANPVLGELLQTLVWPSDLSTIDGDCMLVRETTHRFSPLSFHRAMIRQRMPLLFTSPDAPTWPGAARKNEGKSCSRWPPATTNRPALPASQRW